MWPFQNRRYRPPATGGLITTGLRLRFESDGARFSAARWDDDIAGVSLTVQPSMAAPSVVSGGTPSGQDYLGIGSNEGLGSVDLSGKDIPDGAAPRTMYVVARVPLDLACNYCCQTLKKTLSRYPRFIKGNLFSYHTVFI